MEKAESKNVRPFGMRDKIGYALGDTGCNFSFQLVSSYMYLFYTQCIGLSAAHWAWIIIVSKVWDAINDILIGNMIDRVHLKNSKSKYKPWIFIGSIFLTVFSIMLFVPVTGFNQGGKIAWCLISYCLWSVAYTLVNVPYGSLMSSMTSDPNQRTALSSFRSIGAMIPGVLIMLLPTLVYKDNVLSANTVFIITIVFSIAAFFAFLGTNFLTTERIVQVEKTDKHETKPSIWVSLKAFFTNRALIGLTVATIAIVIFYNSTMSVNNLVFQFYFNDASKTTIATIVSYIPFLMFLPFATKLTAKFGKRAVLSVCGVISVVAGVFMLVLPITPNLTGMILYIACLMFVNVGCFAFQIVVWAMVTDCISVSFKKTGVHTEGSLYALYSFFRKLAQGIGSALVALSLSAVGYIETAPVQTPEAAANIKMVYIAMLTIGLALMTAAIFFIYNIKLKDEKKFAEESAKSNAETATEQSENVFMSGQDAPKETVNESQMRENN